VKTKYAAHLVLAIKWRDGPQPSIPLFENVRLVYAESDADAHRLACALGRQEEEDLTDDGLRWDGRPARYEFVGVRKLIECRPADGRLGHGAEVTYSQLTVRTEDDLKKFAAGQPVEVLYQE
jgi:Domain of unknown function (DUF4288)